MSGATNPRAALPESVEQRRIAEFAARQLPIHHPPRGSAKSVITASSNLTCGKRAVPSHGIAPARSRALRPLLGPAVRPYDAVVCRTPACCPAGSRNGRRHGHRHRRLACAPRRSRPPRPCESRAASTRSLQRRTRTELPFATTRFLRPRVDLFGASSAVFLSRQVFSPSPARSASRSRRAIIRFAVWDRLAAIAARMQIGCAQATTSRFGYSTPQRSATISLLGLRGYHQKLSAAQPRSRETPMAYPGLSNAREIEAPDRRPRHRSGAKALRSRTPQWRVDAPMAAQSRRD